MASVGKKLSFLDRYLTFITERALAAGAAEHHAKGAIAIMMDPRTGEVLAMASVPTFNPNEPGTAADAEARNRAITDTYVHHRLGAGRRGGAAR